MEEDKISNAQIKITHDDLTEELFDVIKIDSRSKAILILKTEVESIIDKSTAKEFVKLDSYVRDIAQEYTDFDRLRNYEIESRLDITFKTFGYKIDELCPFNGFKFFD